MTSQKRELEVAQGVDRGWWAGGFFAGGDVGGAVDVAFQGAADYIAGAYSDGQGQG
jgi:hypothetical protein